MSNQDLKLYKNMLLIRMAEEEIANRYKFGEMRCPTHLSIGQEAAASGVGQALKKTDLALSTHRGHAHYLAKGGNLNRMIAEIRAKTKTIKVEGAAPTITRRFTIKDMNG